MKVFLVFALVGWTGHLLGCVLFIPFVGVFWYSQLFSVLGLLIAWGHVLVNTRWHNLCIAIAGSLASGIMWWEVGQKSMYVSAAFAQQWCLWPALYAWVLAGGFCYLRVTREHPSLPEEVRKPVNVVRRTLILLTGIGILGWAVMLIGNFLALSSRPEWSHLELPFALGGLLSFVGFFYAIAGIGHKPIWKFLFAMGLAISACLVTVMDGAMIRFALCTLFFSLLALVPLIIMSLKDHPGIADQSCAPSTD